MMVRTMLKRYPDFGQKTKIKYNFHRKKKNYSYVEYIRNLDKII